MFTEVWPAFLPNLISVTGEWTGWTAEFVQERVLEHYRPRYYISWKINPFKRFFCSKWAVVEQQIIGIRDETANHNQ
jgi:hypothetical protein